MYLCIKPFDKKAIDGNIPVPEGAELTLNGNVLYYGNKKICYRTSQNCYDHFSLNDDGKGAERHNLILSIFSKLDEWNAEYAQACEEEKAKHPDEEDTSYLDNIENKTLDFMERVERDYPSFLTPRLGGIGNWTKDFYEAPIETLTQLA